MLENVHFSVRLKVLLVIVGIIAGITGASLFPSLWIGQHRFTETVESDMAVSGAIAAALVSQNLEFLKKDAETAAIRIILSPGEESIATAARRRGYRSINILEASGAVHTYGEPLFSPDAFSNEYSRRAFGGEAVVSSTEWAVNGDLVIRVWVPLGEDRVLCAVLPGMILSDIIAGFRIWKTGTVFALDEEGTFIAYSRPELVLTRKNYVAEGESSEGEVSQGEVSPDFRGTAEVHRRMIRGERGIGYYSFEGVPRLCAYTPIPDSGGWSLGVVAPSQESPLSGVRQMLLLSHGIFLLLGLAAAFFFANNIAALFFRIEEQNRSLEELMKAAESASVAKSSFLANMSHEMRTPLNAIIGLSELELGSERLPGDSAENMEKIYTSGINLLGIINDILDISKVEAGKFELAPVVYDLASLVNDTVNINVVRIGSKSIEFRLHIEATMPAKLSGDELRVKQIFNNLLSNAFKYTREGAVDWHLWGERRGDAFFLMSRVEDTGIGIKEEDLPKLFADYNRVDTKKHRGTEGTGLGLSITKRMAELMGGAIEVESEYGKGSVFTVSLKQGLVDDRVIGTETADNLAKFRYAVQRRGVNQRLRRAYIPYATVLVVDDVATNLDVARGMLKPYGMTVDCVNSGQKAVNLIREGKIRYTAIFMDHMMPEMDGIEAVRIIRNEIDTPYAREIPIIALTANAILGNDELFLKNGFQDFLSKPIDVIRLDAVINRWIRDKDKEKDLELPPESGEAPEGAPLIPPGKTVKGLDMVRGFRRFEGNEEAYLQVLRTYAAHTPELLAAIREVVPEKLGDYTVNIHGIKGSSYTISADELGKQAEDLERAAREGDIDYVRAHNGGLIRAAEALLWELGRLLEEIKTPEERPRKNAPDLALLEAVLRASEAYDMEALEEALAKLEEFRYEKDGDLVNWIREQAAKSEFGKIIKRLT